MNSQKKASNKAPSTPGLGKFTFLSLPSSFLQSWRLLVTTIYCCLTLSQNERANCFNTAQGANRDFYPTEDFLVESGLLYNPDSPTLDNLHQNIHRTECEGIQQCQETQALVEICPPTKQTPAAAEGTQPSVPCSEASCSVPETLRVDDCPTDTQTAILRCLLLNVSHIQTQVGDLKVRIGAPTFGDT